MYRYSWLITFEIFQIFFWWWVGGVNCIQTFFGFLLYLQGPLALARNCCLARMLPGEAELVSEWTGLPGEAKSLKRFERSNGLDTALYKNYLYLLFFISMSLCQSAWRLLAALLSPLHFVPWQLLVEHVFHQSIDNLVRLLMTKLKKYWWLSWSADTVSRPFAVSMNFLVAIQAET